MLALLVSGLMAASPNPYLPLAIEQVRALEEAAALETLEKARRWPSNTVEELALVTLYTGLAHAGLARESLAMENFRAALTLNPDLTLPPSVSPKIQEWWEKARGERQTRTEPPVSIAQLSKPTAEPAHVPLANDLRPLPEAPAPSWKRWSGISLVALSVLAASAGAWMGASSRGLSAEVRDEPLLNRAQALQRQAEQRAVMANVFFISAGVTALGGGGLLLLSRQP